MSARQWVTADDLDDAIIAIGYWSEAVHLDGEHGDVPTLGLRVVERHTVFEGGQWVDVIEPAVVVTVDALNAAAVRILTTDEVTVSTYVLRDLVGDDVDADVLDVLVQVAMFGRIVYG